MMENPRTKEIKKTDNTHTIKKMELLGMDFILLICPSMDINMCPYTNSVWQDDMALLLYMSCSISSP